MKKKRFILMSSSSVILKLQINRLLEMGYVAEEIVYIPDADINIPTIYFRDTSTEFMVQSFPLAIASDYLTERTNDILHNNFDPDEYNEIYVCYSRRGRYLTAYRLVIGEVFNIQRSLI